MKVSPRWLPTALLAAFSLGLHGCAGYHLGPSNGTEAGSRSVEVALFSNETPEPRLSEPLANALRKRLQQDGTFRLASHGDGDVQVTGTIVHYLRDPLSFQRTDIITTRDYDVRMSVHVRAVERASGKVLLDRDIEGRTTIQGGADLGSAERQATPVLAEDLARRITGYLADGTW